MGADDLPKRARTPCRKPSCPQLTDRGYCPTHQREAYQLDQQRRGTAAQRGYDGQWLRYSREYRRTHPSCAYCGGASAHVDHISPVAGPLDPLFWDPANHQALCHSCHSRKTVTTDKRGLNHPPLYNPLRPPMGYQPIDNGPALPQPPKGGSGVTWFL